MSAQDIYASPPSFRRRINSFVVLFFIGLIPLFAHAGGLGMAPLVAIIGGMGWLAVTSYKELKPSAPIIALFAFLLWAALTSLWSPYETDGFLTNPIKLLIGVCLFLGVFQAVKAAKSNKPLILRHLFWAINILACGLIIIDILSGYSLTFLVDPIGANEDMNRKRGDAEMNIGHSVTILLLFFSVLVTSLVKTNKTGWAWSFLYFIGLTWAAYLAGLEVGILTAIVVFITLIAAKRAPVHVVRLTLLFVIISILFAPLLQWILPYLPTESLPLSWQHRVAMWDYTAQRIGEAPFWGHGFDAVRTFDDTMTLGVAESWRIVSLHPHNAGLHIWVETGLIGASLASLTLFFIGRKAVDWAKKSSTLAMTISGFIIAVTIISSVTYGVWQDWWWASVIITTAFIYLCEQEEIHVK